VAAVTSPLADALRDRYVIDREDGWLYVLNCRAFVRQSDLVVATSFDAELK
jgi:hypothetical protein